MMGNQYGGGLRDGCENDAVGSGGWGAAGGVRIRDGTEGGAAGAAGAAECTACGAGDGWAVSADGGCAGRRGGAVVSCGVAVSECEAGAGAGAVHDEPGFTGTDQQHCECAQSVD